MGEETYLKTGFLPADYVTGPQRAYWEAAYLRQVIERDKSMLLVVFDDDLLIGMSEVELLTPADAVMWKLYVRHRYHGQGIGSRLLQENIDRLPDTVQRLKTEYYDSNTPAARFYEARGFKFLERKEERFGAHLIPYTFVSRSLARG